MKKTYEEPEMSITILTKEDVICDSKGDNIGPLIGGESAGGDGDLYAPYK